MPNSVLTEAAEILRGARQGDYGCPERNHKRIAALWSTYLDTDITPRQVCGMMVLLKLSRDANSPKRDNAVDIAGYAQLMEEV
jgi:hypothetical protein